VERSILNSWTHFERRGRCNGHLSTVPAVSRFAAQRPDRPLVAAHADHRRRGLNANAQGSDSVAEHVRPEMEAQRQVCVGRFHLRRRKTRHVTGTSRMTRILRLFKFFKRFLFTNFFKRLKFTRPLPASEMALHHATAKFSLFKNQL
jgi:hypothetical protein